MLYVMASVLWILLLAILGVFQRQTSLSHLILIIPLVVYAVGFTNVSTHERVEADMFRGDFVAVALVFVILFVKWVDKRPTSTYILRITLAAFALIVVSMIDVWVSYRSVIVEKHVKSALHTAGITLLLYVLFVYFSEAMAAPSTPMQPTPTAADSGDVDGSEEGSAAVAAMAGR